MKDIWNFITQARKYIKLGRYYALLPKTMNILAKIVMFVIFTLLASVITRMFFDSSKYDESMIWTGSLVFGFFGYVVLASIIHSWYERYYLDKMEHMRELAEMYDEKAPIQGNELQKMSLHDLYETEYKEKNTFSNLFSHLRRELWPDTDLLQELILSSIKNKGQKKLILSLFRDVKKIGHLYDVDEKESVDITYRLKDIINATEKVRSSVEKNSIDIKKVDPEYTKLSFWDFVVFYNYTGILVAKGKKEDARNGYRYIDGFIKWIERAIERINTTQRNIKSVQEEITKRNEPKPSIPMDVILYKKYIGWYAAGNHILYRILRQANTILFQPLTILWFMRQDFHSEKLDDLKDRIYRWILGGFIVGIINIHFFFYFGMSSIVKMDDSLIREMKKTGRTEIISGIDSSEFSKLRGDTYFERVEILRSLGETVDITYPLYYFGMAKDFFKGGKICVFGLSLSVFDRWSPNSLEMRRLYISAHLSLHPEQKKQVIALQKIEYIDYVSLFMTDNNRYKKASNWYEKWLEFFPWGLGLIIVLFLGALLIARIQIKPINESVCYPHKARDVWFQRWLKYQLWLVVLCLILDADILSVIVYIDKLINIDMLIIISLIPVIYSVIIEWISSRYCNDKYLRSSHIKKEKKKTDIENKNSEYVSIQSYEDYVETESWITVFTIAASVFSAFILYHVFMLLLLNIAEPGQYIIGILGSLLYVTLSIFFYKKTSKERVFSFTEKKLDKTTGKLIKKERSHGWMLPLAMIASFLLLSLLRNTPVLDIAEILFYITIIVFVIYLRIERKNKKLPIIYSIIEEMYKKSKKCIKNFLWNSKDS